MHAGLDGMLQFLEAASSARRVLRRVTAAGNAGTGGHLRDLLYLGARREMLPASSTRSARTRMHTHVSHAALKVAFAHHTHPNQNRDACLHIQ